MGWADANWVQKRKKAEEHLKCTSESLWQDVIASIEDASRSFNELYGKEFNRKASTALTNDHRVRVSVADANKDTETVDVDFNRENKTIEANYHQRSSSRVSFRLSANHESAFILDESNNQASPGEVSRLILQSAFFQEQGSIYDSRGMLIIG
jgi:hypothetical protein